MKSNSERFKKIKFILKLLKYHRPYKCQLIIIFVFTLFSTLLSLLPTYLIRPLTDKVFAPPAPIPIEDRLWTLHLLVILFVLVHVVGAAVSSTLGYYKEWLGEKIGINLRHALYAKLQKLSLKFFNLEKVGELHSRVRYDTMSLQYFIVSELMQLFIYVVMFVGIGVILFYLDWRLSILLLMPVPLIILLSNAYGERLTRTYRRSYKKIASMNSLIFNFLKGIIVVKTNVAEERELVKFDQADTDSVTEKLHCAKLNFLFMPSIGFIIYLCGVLVYWLGGYKVVRGELTLGEMMVFIGYMWQFYGPVSDINSIYARYQNTAVAAERVFKLLDTEPEIRNAPDAIDLPCIQGNVRFDNVTFTYDGKKNVLEGINLEAKPGEIVGIAGPSGAGKSTLAYLLCRLYSISGGSVSINEYDLRRVKIESLLNQIGLVLQETILFYGTVAENIAYGKPEASRMEIISAAKAAGSHDFIMQLPDAYDTLLREGGVGLSGGERQRISIARILLKDPKIIIFDEATSSVDLGSQRIIQTTIKKLAAEHTIFIISHHPSMLKITDKLIVLDHGKIVESGTYDNLIKTGGIFTRFLEEEKLEDI